ncbi:MAG: SDR family oxidoreductase [Patescibacteria group bacterium]|nr:SDR family oxidoreductase [Patescibacteria group bacterium]
MKLKNKVAVIFGGSGGIGIHIAEHFCRAEARVVIIGKNSEKLRSAVQFVEQVTGKKPIAISADIANYAAVRRAIGNAVKKFHRLDILVNCAGIQQPIGPFESNDINLWRKNIEVNLLGTVYACKAAISFFKKQKSGSVINFSGGGATSPRPNFSAYAAAKTGVVRFTEILADELKPYRIRVNAIAPGAVNTGMLAEVLKAGKLAGSKEIEAARKRSRDGGASPNLAATLAVFLASSDSHGLTGKLISAPWDGWQKWKKRDIKKIMASEKFTLRRIP